ncbi:MAG: hypothetical protein INR62_11635 [Rhodospirillales bacterium]|nr:hypothetical protein [Acetobacter sp.]
MEEKFVTVRRQIAAAPVNPRRAGIIYGSSARRGHYLNRFLKRRTGVGKMGEKSKFSTDGFFANSTANLASVACLFCDLDACVGKT